MSRAAAKLSMVTTECFVHPAGLNTSTNGTFERSRISSAWLADSSATVSTRPSTRLHRSTSMAVTSLLGR